MTLAATDAAVRNGIEYGLSAIVGALCAPLTQMVLPVALFYYFLILKLVIHANFSLLYNYRL